MSIYSLNGMYSSLTQFSIALKKPSQIYNDDDNKRGLLDACHYATISVCIISFNLYSIPWGGRYSYSLLDRHRLIFFLKYLQVVMKFLTDGAFRLSTFWLLILWYSSFIWLAFFTLWLLVTQFIRAVTGEILNYLFFFSVFIFS